MKNDTDWEGVSIILLFFLVMAVSLALFLIIHWVEPSSAIEEGAFEYEDEVYLVEKAPPGTILRDGKIYRTEEFTQTQPATEE